MEFGVWSVEGPIGKGENKKAEDADNGKTTDQEKHVKGYQWEDTVCQKGLGCAKKDERKERSKMAREMILFRLSPQLST